jgi:two-component system cell cycle response regulator
MQDSFTDDAEITQVTKLPVDFLNRVTSEKRGTITVLMGTDVGAIFPISSQAVLIGRNPRAHIPLEDDGISRNQARILRQGKDYALEDTASTNGTYIDGVRARGSVSLRDGARIQMGNTLLRFAMCDELELQAGKRVYEASVRDSLSGAFNRRYFEERLIGEFAFAARHGTDLCVILTDIDDFKQINDRWGHLAGDLVLRRIGAELRTAVRAEDVLARYGGEEFSVLARGIGAPGARALAERLRTSVERTEIGWEGEQLRVTISVGLAHNHAGPAASDPQRLVAAADKALYAAKKAGRNRVELAYSPGRYSVVQSTPPDAVTPAAKTRRTWDQSTRPLDEASKAALLAGKSKKPPTS